MADFDTWSIGTTPYEEDCAQTGARYDYADLQRLECKAYIEALRKVHGPEPEGLAELRIKANPHDFGTYREVEVRFRADSDEALAYAQKVEAGLATWDEAGMWAPVKYADGKPIHVLRTPESWDREKNPQALPTAPAG